MDCKVCYVILLALLTSDAVCQPNPYSREATLEKVAARATTEVESSHTSTVLSTRITANDPRPLLQASLALKKEFGWPIDYEDPIYTGADTIYFGVHLVPRGGQFVAIFPSPLMGTRKDRASTISALVKSYNLSHNPGHFTIINNGHRIDIVGGAPGSVPLLSVVISLPTIERSVSELIAAVCNQLEALEGVRIRRVGLVDMALERKRVTVGGTNVSARSLIAEALDSMSDGRTWILNYDIEAHLFAFSINPVIQSNMAPNGLVVRSHVPTSSF